MQCSTLGLIHTIGKRWLVVLLEEIALGKFDGFNSVLKRSHLTPRILSNQLKEMESLGIVEKNKAGKYSVTKRGSELMEIVNQLKTFNKKWDPKTIYCVNKSCLECSNFNY